MGDLKCGALHHDMCFVLGRQHTCDSPPGHPHMRNHGCTCGYAWPKVEADETPTAAPCPADDPEFLKREIGRIKTHFHRRCETLTTRAQRAEHANEALRGVLGELIDWFGAPDWTGPSLPVDLGKRINDLMVNAPASAPGMVCEEEGT